MAAIRRIFKPGIAPAVALAMVVGLAAAVGPAKAQTSDVKELLDRLDRMERDLTILQRQVYRGGAGGDAPAPAPGAMPSDPDAMSGQPLTPAVADRLMVRIDEIENLITQLTGQIERLQFELSQANGRLERMARDYEFRFSQIEQRLAGAPVGAAPQAGQPTPMAETGQPGDGGPATVTRRYPFGQGPGQPVMTGEPAPLVGDSAQPAPQPSAQPAQPPQQAARPAARPASPATPEAPADTQTVVLPQGDDKAQYEYARSFLTRANYGAAEKALTAFLDANPESSYAGNAMYWLGETYYVREDYAQAAATFIEGFQKFPDSSKAPDNLLKLGLSLARSGQPKDACTAFQLLNSKFPDALEVIKRRAEAEKAQLGCE